MHKTKNQLRSTGRGVRTLLSLAGAALTAGAFAQTAAAPAAEAPKPVTAASEEEVVVLSPFEVTSEATTGYAAATTLAGNRLNTELRDIGSAVSVVTNEFLKDVGATDNKSLLQYTTGTEVGGTGGNFGGNGDGPRLDESGKFINPNSNTRVRGLAAADNTRDFFMTDIPWEGYAVDGVDLQRGANSILFGMGSPAGIINTRTKQAMFRNANEVGIRVGSYGANRQNIDLNRVLIEDQLSLRIAAVRNDDQFKQDPAFSKDERVYGALRFEPAFLKKNGMRTIVKANYEAGRVRSNNPRTMPPIDLITPWFYTGTYLGKNLAGGTVTYKNLNRETFNAAQLVDDNTGLPNHGQVRPTVNGGPTAGQPNPAYNPWIGNFAQQFGGPIVFFDGASTAQSSMWLLEPRQEFAGAVNSLGQVTSGKRNIGGENWQRPGGVAKYADFAKNARLPYAQFGVHKDILLTDSSVFDFYNQLLDGPNKKEWQDFRAYNVSLAQTFLNEQVGFELVYNNELYKQGRLSLLSGANQGIYVDIMNVRPDGTTTGKNGEPFADGTPNPNVGRAYLSDNGGSNNSSLISEKESMRATVFATHDFSKDGKNWALRFLGKQTATGLFSSDVDERDNRSWIRYTTSDAYAESIRAQGQVQYKINSNEVLANTLIYLGPSLLSRTTASGAYLPNPTEVQTVASGSVNTFVGNWNKPTDPAAAGYVNPGAVWINDYYPDSAPFNTATGARNSTQSENPANYVGWTTVPLTWIDSEESAANREHNTTNARLTRSRLTSSAFVWQGHFWDNALVGTWGVRRDIAKSWSTSQDTGSTSGRGVLSLTPDKFYLKDAYDNRLQITSHSWMAVAHLNEFPGLSQLMEKLPVNVTLFYNKSMNFQPSAARVDIYGSPLAPPKGATTDQGFLLETKDGKYSLKVNKYETTSTNVTSQTLNGGMGFIGGSQTWSGNWANHFQYDLTGDALSTAVVPPDPRSNRYNYEPSPIETAAAAAAGLTGEEAVTEAWRLASVREANVVSAWRKWQASVDPRFYAAWQINLAKTDGITSSAPAGLAATEDSISKGYEIEFNAQATKNWRLTFNAARTTAQRNNVGGAALNDFVSKYETELNKGVGSVGDLRVWWGGAGNETALYQWNANFGSTYHMLVLQEGTNVPELRKWRFNAISNYDFDQGFMKGVNVGGGMRYESSIVIGYPVIDGPVSTQAFYDIGNPYKGDGEINFDFWVGYTRKIWKNVEWQIQLNVRNAFVGNEITAITTQPDGTPAGYRIRPPQTWQLSNTFRF